MHCLLTKSEYYLLNNLTNTDIYHLNGKEVRYVDKHPITVDVTIGQEVWKPCRRAFHEQYGAAVQVSNYGRIRRILEFGSYVRVTVLTKCPSRRYNLAKVQVRVGYQWIGIIPAFEVLFAFHGEPKKYADRREMAEYLDGDPLNTKVTNLRWKMIENPKGKRWGSFFRL